MPFPCHRVAYLADALVDARLEFHERTVGPDANLQLATRDDLSGTFHQGVQDAERLLRKIDLHPTPPQLARRGVELERSKADGATADVRCHEGATIPRPV